MHPYISAFKSVCFVIPQGNIENHLHTIMPSAELCEFTVLTLCVLFLPTVTVELSKLTQTPSYMCTPTSLYLISWMTVYNFYCSKQLYYLLMLYVQNNYDALLALCMHASFEMSHAFYILVHKYAQTCRS